MTSRKKKPGSSASTRAKKSLAATDATRVVVGLMSGTALDGISAAVVRFSPGDNGSPNAELLAFNLTEYTPQQRSRLHAAMAGGTPADYCRINVDLGEWLAQAAVEVIAEAGIARSDIAAIASHGQTIWHEPGHSTWQIGEAAVIAERTRLPVISDFRSRDMAAGGQGAPLVSLADAVLFSSPDTWRCLQNIGGIGNVTVVPPHGDQDGIRAFDTGPGMVIVDAIVRTIGGGDLAYDRDAVLSRQGKAIDSVVTETLTEPYFAAEPPKSTGRELFSPAYVERFIARCRAAKRGASVGDIVATAVHLTAASIADAYRRCIPEPVTEVVIAGGGSKHPLLVEELTRRLAPWKIRAFDDVYFDAEAKEAVAFALMAHMHLSGRAGNVPRATGARGPRILGKLTPP
jgi:anhydro-N-acetylmuramic acid kinase